MEEGRKTPWANFEAVLNFKAALPLCPACRFGLPDVAASHLLFPDDNSAKVKKGRQLRTNVQDKGRKENDIARGKKTLLA